MDWHKRFIQLIQNKYNKKESDVLVSKYEGAFPPGYIDDNEPEAALLDIAALEKISSVNPLNLRFYIAETPKWQYPLHLRLFQWENPIPLSDILPMLDNLDLRTYNERPTKVKLKDNKTVWISDFAISYNRGNLDFEILYDIFKDAFTKIYFGSAENDGFNKLILAAGLSWREIMILRTYAKYLHQTRFRFSQNYIEKALLDNAEITKQLVQFFLIAHHPHKSDRKIAVQDLEEKILKNLEKVGSLDEDRILRRLLDLIKATLRTNYYQLNPEGKIKPYLSIKLNSRHIPELPLPKPLYEIFVYSPRFEGIHLRNTKVARGGIRWSDRREDFRTEILGLMKAQVVKNAIIVPSGAKGGFVLKAVSLPSTREILQVEVIACYKLFISGLLDLTDNIIEDKYVHPKEVVCYDDFDPYLVVAADKGTAAFSDIANGISKEYNFWLNDAFASGGATGYDHKKMGITARGAWESIKRHFHEINVDVLKTHITVVGIGDMSGDVFGNGMIYSNYIKLVAAFDHRDIFIDPHPDAKISFAERERLFHLPISSWQDYNPKLISKGGGVFKRSLKSIPITPEMKAVLGIEESALTPSDLIRAILKAPVDLLYNGGIGTYVKAKSESAADVGDRANDYCRVNGEELRCKVVGEGGNLGFTQLGRVEYALTGGLINTDFIDNSAGVDCSDHEVNLKILLDREVNQNKLTCKKRNTLLASLTDEVATLVLADNYYQAFVMSFSAFHAVKNITLHSEYIRELEAQGTLNRKVEFLPDDKQLIERKAAGLGLTRPELAILLAYTKISIKQDLLKSKLLEDHYLSQIIETAFPPTIRKKYAAAMGEHRLHRDIIATQLSNQVINEMGITFVYRLQIETGASVVDIIRAYTVASHIFGTTQLQRLIETLNFKILLSEQYEMFFNLRNLVNLSTRWFLHSPYLKQDLAGVIDHFSQRVRTLAELTPGLMGGFTRQYLDTLTKKFIDDGLPEGTAKKIATYRAIYTALNIIEVATKNNFDLVKTAQVYFAAGERVNLIWFRDQIATDRREGHWNALARLTLRDELDKAQRALTVAIIKHNQAEKNPQELIEAWVISHQRSLQRWERLLAMLVSNNNADYSMFFIAVKELMSLVAATQYR